MPSARLTEIKTIRVPAEHVHPSRQVVHWAQAMLYGFCVCQGRPMTLELLYVNTLSNHETRLSRSVSAADLASFAHELPCSAICPVARPVWKRCTHARPTRHRRLSFPSMVSVAWQRSMAVGVYRSIRDGQNWLCEAPTGIGKSLSSLFPAIKALGEGTVSQVVYLTAKTSGAQGTFDALRHLQRGGLFINALVLRARRRSCFCDRGRVERDAAGVCPMTLGFHDRLADARAELMANGHHRRAGDRRGGLASSAVPAGARARAVAVGVAGGRRLCVRLRPAGQTATLRRERSGRWRCWSTRRTTCPIVPAACCRHSSIATPASGPCRPVGATTPASLRQALDAVLRAPCQTLARDHGAGPEALIESPVPLARAAQLLHERITEAAAEPGTLPDRVLELWHEALRYCVVHDLYGAQHRTLVTATAEVQQVRLVCLDASASLARDYRHFRAAIFFSATLRPPTFYRQVLGLPASTAHLALASPFAASRCAHLWVPWIDTRYHQRHRSEAALVDLLARVIAERSGNYLAFFPSYAYLQQIQRAFQACHPGIETWQQTPGLDALARSALLQRLDEPGRRLGFAIMGGVMGEGVDYAGDALIGVIVVGVGLPAVSVEQDLLADYYRQAGFDGYDHGYRYPGFIRVLQAAGRLIRRDDDHGVVVWVDPRLQQPAYQALVPAEWHLARLECKARLTLELQHFWQRQETPVPRDPIIAACTDPE